MSDSAQIPASKGPAAAPVIRPGMPAAPEFSDPRSDRVASWLHAVVKTVKATRVYDRNNAMFMKFADDMVAYFNAILEGGDSITLNVREDRLLFGEDAVLVDADRENGLPFLLYRNALRRLTFEAGMDADELLSFVDVLKEESVGDGDAGEDLVTALWRHQLPHLGYFAIDALSVASGDGSPDAEMDQLERLQLDVDELVAAIYGRDPTEDAIKGASISKEDLEALKEVRQERPEDLDLLDVATARALNDISEAQLAELRGDAPQTSEEVLVWTYTLLAAALYRARDGKAFADTLSLIVQIYDSLLVAQQFREAKRIVDDLKTRESEISDLRELQVTRHLLAALANQTRITQIVSGLGEGARGTIEETQELLRSYGQHAVNSLLGILDVLEASRRKMVCEMILELGVSDPDRVVERFQGAKSATRIDMMDLARTLPEQHRARIIIESTRDSHPKLRKIGLLALQDFPAGTAEDIIRTSFQDVEPDVRITAFRVAAARGSAQFGSALKIQLLQDSFWDLDLTELRVLTATYAAVSGESGVSVLAKILKQGFFPRANRIDGQVAAAYALGQINTDTARAELVAGRKTLSLRLRAVCKEAMTPAGAAQNQSEFLSLASDQKLVAGGDEEALAAARRREVVSEAAQEPQFDREYWRNASKNLGLSGVRTVHRDAPSEQTAMPESLSKRHSQPNFGPGEPPADSGGDD